MNKDAVSKSDEFQKRLAAIDTLVFDYDGTIHNSIVLYAPAFRKAFDYLVSLTPDYVIEAGYALDKDWTDEEISQWLGYTKDEMWSTFMPNLPEGIRNRAGKMIGDEMARLLRAGGSALYSNALETLATLESRGYKLIFLSNCSVSYMDNHKQLFELERYFDTFACAGAYPGLSKADILKGLISDGVLVPEKAAIIGDRRHDVDAGKSNGLVTIGCSYGFSRPGELDPCDMIIDAFSALGDLFSSKK